MATKKGTIPDITRLVKQHVIAYREGIRLNNTAGMMLSLDSLRAWNVLLPTQTLKDSFLREYGIVESTAHYTELTRSRRYIQCPNCNKDIEFDPRQFGERIISIDEMERDGRYAIHYAIWNNKKMQTWTCPDCTTSHDMHDLDLNQIIHIETPEKIEPNILRVVPAPPTQDQYTTKVDGHNQWLHQMRIWASRMYIELTAETARWRMDKMKSGELVADLAPDREYESDSI